MLRTNNFLHLLPHCTVPKNLRTLVSYDRCSMVNHNKIVLCLPPDMTCAFSRLNHPFWPRDDELQEEDEEEEEEEARENEQEPQQANTTPLSHTHLLTAAYIH